jgi:hypothetical protein
MTTAGGPLPDVEEVELWRAHLPTAQEPRGNTSRDRAMREQILQSRGERLLLLDTQALERATRGSALEIRDDLVSWYEDNQEEMPLVLWYAVRTVCCNGRESAFSNIARFEPQLPPPPPTNFVLEGTEAGISLVWESPPGAVTVVERSADGVAWEALTDPPLEVGEWLDASAEQGRTWRYRLRSIRTTADGGRVVGNPGSEEAVEHPDQYPPNPPQDLVCLPEGEKVRLRWGAVEDAAAYRIHRRQGAGAWRRLVSQHHERELDDNDPPAGNLTYAVKAVDAAGNESEAATCTTVRGGSP